MAWQPPAWLANLGDPPATGNYKLASVEGTVSWVEDFAPEPTGGPIVPFKDGEHWDWTNVGAEGQIVTAAAQNKAVFANPGAG